MDPNGIAPDMDLCAAGEARCDHLGLAYLQDLRVEARSVWNAWMGDQRESQLQELR